MKSGAWVTHRYSSAFFRHATIYTDGGLMYLAAETRKQQGEEAKQQRGRSVSWVCSFSDENGLKSRAEIAFAVSHFMDLDAKVQGLF